MTMLIERNITITSYPPLATTPLEATPAFTTQGFSAHSPALPAPESASLIDNILNSFTNTAEAGEPTDLLAQSTEVAKNRFNAYRWAADQGREVTGTVYLENGIVKTMPGVVNDPCILGDACIATSATFGDYRGDSANIIGDWHTHPAGGENHLSKGDIANTPSLNHYPNYQYSFLGGPNGEAYVMDHAAMLKLKPLALGGTLTGAMIQHEDIDLGKY